MDLLSLFIIGGFITGTYLLSQAYRLMGFTAWEERPFEESNKNLKL